jgi:hypothetical protein
MITVNLTMDEAHVVADAISELAERDERNEPILGLIDCKRSAPPATNWQLRSARRRRRGIRWTR